MTLDQLEVWIKEAKRIGVTGDIELKVYNPIVGVVVPIKGLEFRLIYNLDGSEYRSKYILIK